MISTSEIVHGLTGAWRIAMLDATAARHFDLSADGFRRSFWALAITVPIIFFTTASLWQIGQASGTIELADFTSFVTVQVGATVLYWAAYLLVMIGVARHLRLGSSYAAYVIVFNWGEMMTSALFALPLLLNAFGILPSPIAVTLMLPAMAALVWYRWQIARQVLGATPPAAAAILALDLALNLMLDHGLASLVFMSGGETP